MVDSHNSKEETKRCMLPCWSDQTNPTLPVFVRSKITCLSLPTQPEWPNLPPLAMSL